MTKEKDKKCQNILFVTKKYLLLRYETKNERMTMRKNILIVLVNLLLCCAAVGAQEAAKSDLQQRAEAVNVKENIAQARSLYIRAFEDYANKGQMQQAVECGAKGAALYYKENFYKEAFDLLRRIDASILNSQAADKSALQYYVTKERLQMYMKLRKSASAQDQLAIMDREAAATKDERVKDDLLYTKAVYYYTFGMNEKGNAVFGEMTSRLTASKAYDKVDDAYQTLIANGRRSGNSNMVAQAYSSYIAWKDSVSELKRADEVGALKKQIQEGEATIAERDSSLKARAAVITGLGVLSAILAAALVLGLLVLLRFIVLTRKQRKTIRQANENNALKAKFISNISAQLEPTLKKLNSGQPEVRALLDFSSHIQTLSQLERTDIEVPQLEDTQIPQFCEAVAAEVRPQIKSSVHLKVDVPHMSAPLCREYVHHILHHLLSNAALYTPEEGHITLEFKKRGPHKLQFIVSNTGSAIPEEKREDVFKPFLEIHDLTEGDGLGLPICRQMALCMNGDLNIDPQFTRGTRFVLDLQV